MDTDYIYRVRPINEFTLDELKNSYLWFSRPCGFSGDFYDSNIRAFVEDTQAIKNGIELVNPKFPFEEWYNGISKIGICCFTRKHPQKSLLKRFPKCYNGSAICLEYNKRELISFFENHPTHPLHPCFHKVSYARNPTRLEMCGDWSVLWDIHNGYKEFRPLASILYSHPREFDKFIFKLLTRINSKFKKQHEERIIIGGCNIPDLSPDILGYKIKIPESLINRIYIYPNVSSKFRNELMKIESFKAKINFI